MNTCQVILGDSLKVLPTLGAESFDACVTDPPYGIAYQSKARRVRLSKIANDERPFIWWLPEAFRRLKDPGALVCFCRWDVQEPFRWAIELAGFDVRSQLVWDRIQHGSGNVEQDFAPTHDVAWFAVKGDFKFPGKRPHSVIRAQKPNWMTMRHPTEKPLELMLEIVNSVTPKGGRVIDPFAGSGSTGEACKLSGLGFVGIELEEEHFAVAQRRIDEAGALFGRADDDDQAVR